MSIEVDLDSLTLTWSFSEIHLKRQRARISYGISSVKRGRVPQARSTFTLARHSNQDFNRSASLSEITRVKLYDSANKTVNHVWGGHWVNPSTGRVDGGIKEKSWEG
jgi:hypothetical protein